jgi:chorismate mutase
VNGGEPAEGEGGVDTELQALRQRIVELDDELIRLVGRRRDLVLEVGRVKQALGLPVLDPAQEARVVRRAAERARALGVDEELARDVIWRIIASARAAQENRTSWGPPEGPSPQER